MPLINRLRRSLRLPALGGGLLAALPLVLSLSLAPVPVATAAATDAPAKSATQQKQKAPAKATKVSTQKKKTVKKKTVKKRVSSTIKKKKAGATKKRTRKARRHVIPAPPSHGMRMGLHKTPDELALKSSAALVVDQETGETLAMKNADAILPVASLTKLMTALVVMESGASLQEKLEIGHEDVDTVKYTHSRLTVGTELTRDELLLLSLMSSENRAAMALSRHYPGGRDAFIAKMNARAKTLGMKDSHFADAAGLSIKSVSTARDLHKLVTAAYAQPLIRQYSTQLDHTVTVKRRQLHFLNSNRLIRGSGDWSIELQKTGFTNEAGRCLVMQVNLLHRKLAMIFLDSTGTLTRYADASRVRKLVEHELNELQRSNPGGLIPASTTVAQPS